MRASGEEECFTVVLYGTQLEQANIVPLAGDIAALFREAGQPPSHLSAIARGFGKKPLLFARAWKRLEKTFTDDIQSVSLYSLIDNWHTLSDWTTTCSIYQHRQCILVGASLGTMPDGESRFMKLTRHWLDSVRPAYGIGFSRRRENGPDFYAIGCPFGTDVAFSGPEYEEDLTTGRWSDGMDEAVYHDGILRDVYPWSLLTDRHLQRDIDGRPLWAWIQADSQRGELSPFPSASGDSAYTQWTVAPESLPVVRRQLAAAGGLYVLGRENHLE